MSADVNNRLKALAALPEDWDSYGGKAITPKAIQAVREIIDSIFLVPCSTGGIQMGVYTAVGFSLEVEIGPDGRPFNAYLAKRGENP